MRFRGPVCLVPVLLIAMLAWVQSSVAQTKQPTTNPEAKALLDQVRQAYGKLETLELSGTLKLDADVGGQEIHRSMPFSSLYQSPKKFRHEMPDELLVVGTGEKLFAHFVARNQYATADAPAGRTADLPAAVGDILDEQNPSLCLALAEDAAVELAGEFDSVERIDDVDIVGTKYPALKLSRDDREVVALIDPQTSLLRQRRVDMRKMFEKQQVPQVKEAMLVIDYEQVAAGAAVDGNKFAFTPPAGATLFKPEVAAQPGDDESAAQELVGKDAPVLELEDLEGRKVSLNDQRGSVVVLDFWATWCPPCREGLPHLNELARQKQGDGVKVFAVNLREEKDKARQFMSDAKLDLPVLLDFTGESAAAYRVSGIPQTVVIGRDGKVTAVLIGFGPDSPQKLTAAVEQAVKEN